MHTEGQHGIIGSSYVPATAALESSLISRYFFTDVVLLGFYPQFSRGTTTAFMNYIYEVEGPGVKQGLRLFTRFLKTRIIVEAGDEKYVQVLLTKITPS